MREMPTNVEEERKQFYEVRKDFVTGIRVLADMLEAAENYAEMSGACGAVTKLIEESQVKFATLGLAEFLLHLTEGKTVPVANKKLVQALSQQLHNAFSEDKDNTWTLDDILDEMKDDQDGD